MKKLILIAFVVMAFTAVKAQQGLHISMKVAPQSTWLFNNEDSDNANFIYISTWGMMVGPSINYHFSGSIGIGMDFLISKQGQKFYANKAETIEVHRRINYFKLPILFHFNSDPEATVMVTGQLGPQFAFLTKATEETTPDALGIGEVNLNEGLAILGENPVKSVNMGLVFGFGVGINVTDYLQFGAGLRFDAGFGTENTLAAADSGYFNTDSNGVRGQTVAVTGAIEFSVKYILRTD